MTKAAPQALKFASASQFGDFSSREGPPASVFHEIFDFSSSAPDLGPRKSVAKNCLGRSGQTKTTSTYLSTISRADIKNDCRDFEKESKTSPKYPKVLFTVFVCFEAPAT